MIEFEPSAASVQAAYDALASDYDERIAGDDWMRARLWKRYVAYFRNGDHVLDVSCGTGLDAVFLAQSGVDVTGIDISPEMISRCRARADAAKLRAQTNFQVLDYAEINQLSSGSFDGVISAFAGLNTATDLARFADDAARLLRPNGTLIVHMLNRLSLWEWLSHIAHGHLRAARSLGACPQRTFDIGGTPIEHTLSAPIATYWRYFATGFRLERAYALGVLRPPHDMQWIPQRLARTLGVVEVLLGAHRPWRDLGRFFVLELIKRPADDGTG